MAGIGIASIWSGLVIVTYYTIIIAWAILYWANSFKSPLGWSQEGYDNQCGTGAASEYYYRQTLGYQVKDGTSCRFLEPHETEDVQGWVYLCTIIAWVIIYFCVFRGVKSSSYVVWVTVPLPIVLVLILVIRGATLDGADDGIDLYLNGEDSVNSNKALEDDQMWSDATGQIFFTLSICMGVMTSYGSYNKTTKPVILDSFVIAIVNSTVSFISGFAVFSTIGYLRHINSPVSSQMTSFGLAFIAYPTAASTMTGANFWNFLLFTTLFLLGIDSAFSMVEAIATVIYDTPLGRRMNRMVIAAILCIFCALWSLAFCADVGLVLLDVVDYYTNTYMLQILGVLQPFAVGWVYEQDVVAQRIGLPAILTYNVGFWVSTEIPIIIAIFGMDK